MIRVVVADDHHIVRQGICALLEKVPDIEVVGEAQDGREALELVMRVEPDVLVTDISMPHLNGIQVAERLQVTRINTRVIVLSMYSDESLVRQALNKGVLGYLLKRSVAEELLIAIRAASRDETYLSPEVASQVLDDYLAGKSPSGGDTLFEQLSPREREVLKLIAEGNTNREIAELMTISIKTVEKHRANLMAKLNVRDLAGLIRIAIKHGLIFLND